MVELSKCFSCWPAHKHFTSHCFVRFDMAEKWIAAKLDSYIVQSECGDSNVRKCCNLFIRRIGVFHLAQLIFVSSCKHFEHGQFAHLLFFNCPEYAFLNPSKRNWLLCNPFPPHGCPMVVHSTWSWWVASLTNTIPNRVANPLHAAHILMKSSKTPLYVAQNVQGMVIWPSFVFASNNITVLLATKLWHQWTVFESVYFHHKHGSLQQRSQPHISVLWVQMLAESGHCEVWILKSRRLWLFTFRNIFQHLKVVYLVWRMPLAGFWRPLSQCIG